MEFLNELEPTLRVFWYIAIPSSIIFIIQTIMTFVGMDASDGAAADFDSDFAIEDTPFQLFSFRNLMNFLLGFSWSGISFYESLGNHLWLLITISFLIGAAFLYLFFVIIKQLKKLEEDNSFKLSETIGKTGDVYLSIPENKSGRGKILISVKGSVHELEAMTKGEFIPNGALVKVVSIENNNLLFVEKI